MMKKLILFLYKYLPKSLVKKVGSANWLHGTRDLLLRKNSGAKTITVKISRSYPPFKVEFQYCAPIKDAAKAEKKGVENTLLRNTIFLLGKKGITDKSTIFDVGTNYGYLSMVWSQTLAANGGKVYSFEPGMSIYGTFKRTIQINGELADNIIPENIAVGRKSETIELMDFGTTSNVKSQGFEVRERYSIPMVTIDDYVESAGISMIHLIKIDVDGIEYEILQGAKNTLKRWKPILAIETNHDPRILSFCNELGYQVLNMNLSVYSKGQEMPANVFCV